jgi:hypothetical protein
MTRFRRILRPVVMTWLLCQTATLSLAPIVFSISAAEQLLECTCTHGDHAVCPMHHRPAPDSKLCLMQSADDSSEAVFSPLVGAVGLLPAKTQVAAPIVERPLISLEITAPFLRPAPPDPPPPRA